MHMYVNAKPEWWNPLNQDPLKQGDLNKWDSLAVGNALCVYTLHPLKSRHLTNQDTVLSQEYLKTWLSLDVHTYMCNKLLSLRLHSLIYKYMYINFA